MEHGLKEPPAVTAVDVPGAAAPGVGGVCAVGEVITTSGLSKTFPGDIHAVVALDLHVQSGEIFGLLGPNGAGKTTLVNQIIGLLKPTSGTIKIDGVDVIEDPDFARQACSFQAQVQVPITGLTIRNAIELAGRVRGGTKADVLARAQELIEALDIGEWANKRGETLSGGVRRLVFFCMAAVVPGRIVILDEPTNDVDPLRRRLLWQEVTSLKKAGASVLLITHSILEAEKAVDRLAMIDLGKVLGLGTPASFKEHDAGFMRLELVMEPAAEKPDLPEFLSKNGRSWFPAQELSLRKINRERHQVGE